MWHRRCGLCKHRWKKIHLHQLWEGTQYSRKRGLQVYVPGGSCVLFLAGFIFGAGGMHAAFVADQGLCPPRGFLISFKSVQQTFI